MSGKVAQHWNRQPPNRYHQRFMPLGAREFFCRECNAKCTAAPDGREFGHMGGCSHRSPDLPAASNNR